MEIKLKRIYEPCAADDGFRVLVDRLWPRGLGKDKAGVDLWAKDIAPSGELRRWFGHVPERFEEFAARYTAELQTGEALPALVVRLRGHEVVTLLYAAKDEVRNNAAVLAERLKEQLA